MKNKIITMSLICILIFTVSFTVLASKKQVEYDKNGIPLLYPGEDISDDIEDGTPIGIVVDKSNSQIDYKKEKMEFDEKLKNSPSDVITSNENIAEIEKTEVDPFNSILYKYIGQEKVSELYYKISEEIEGENKNTISGFSKSQNELFDLIAQMLEKDELTDDEKEIMSQSLEIIDVSKIEDSKTANSIISFLDK